MFKRLFNTSSQPGKKKPEVVYGEYLSLLSDKLLPLGFKIREGQFIGNFSVFDRENLEISLECELREGATFLTAKSGRKAKFNKVIDQLPEVIRKKAANLQNAGEISIDEPDISLTLAGTEGEKEGLMKDLDEWLAEHS
jgi:hypothetical protein